MAEASWISSRGDGVLPAFSSARAPAASAAPRGGDIPPMSSSGAAATAAATATSFRGGGIPAAVPAAEMWGSTHVSGSGVGPPAVVGASPTPASDLAGAATGELLATEQEQEQLVASGERREVLAEVSRGTSPVGPGALSAASPDPRDRRAWSTTAVLADVGKDSE